VRVRARTRARAQCPAWKGSAPCPRQAGAAGLPFSPCEVLAVASPRRVVLCSARAAQRRAEGGGAGQVVREQGRGGGVKRVR